MKLGLLICTYNRPDYLRRCLLSISNARLPEDITVLVVDDASTSKETIDMIHASGYMAIFKKRNGSIKESMLWGCNFLFETCKVEEVINLDSDAIVREDFVEVLLKLRERFPKNILTGFNCTTKNRNGTIRHRILEHGDGYNTKKSVGGINMMFGTTMWYECVKPALSYSIHAGGNWDHMACINSFTGQNLPIVCAVPSVVQHIGVESSMGHTAGGEPPDVADDFVDEGDWSPKGFEGEVRGDQFHITKVDDKIFLPDVTLVGVDCVSIERLVVAANICQRQITFGDVKLFTSLPSYAEKRIEKISPIKSKEAYSWFIMKDLAKHIRTSHILIIQYDGYVLNPGAWKEEWLQYDYIGAPWEWYTDGMQNGNGGFSLRSKKLMDIVASDDGIYPVSDGLNTHKEEDHCICRIYRKYLEETYQIKFAPVEVARQFSIEGWKSKNKTWTNEFGFHGHGLTNIKP